MMDKRLFFNIMYMYRDSTATFTYKTPEGKVLTRVFPIQEDKFVWRFPSDKKVIEYEDGIYQLNISEIGFTDKDFQEWLPKLEQAKGIIVDWRTGGLDFDFLAHLQNVPDTLRDFDPGKYLYPDREKEKYELSFRPSWSIEPKEPHLKAKIVFLSNAYDGSYLESFLVHVQHYKLGTVIGEQTAGMTGNVIISPLPGGWKAWWTGLYVEKPDGTDFQGVGAIPDIIVHPTVKGIADGRDEILEAGLKYMQEQLGLKELPKQVKAY
jgi:C-terminal processing protease CtpA/Prc